MNAGLYSSFAASLHGKACFHGGYDVIIRQSKARNVGPVQKINMDGGFSAWFTGQYSHNGENGNSVSVNSWGSSRAGINSMRPTKFRCQAGAKNG
jgi:hypothetical protein